MIRNYIKGTENPMIDSHNSGSYGLSIIQPTEKEICLEFICDNEDFMKNFSIILSKFYNEFNGKINIVD